jgi:hypothetical protein
LELVGEGIGFGVAIAKYAGETFFSGSASLQINTKKNFIVIRKARAELLSVFTEEGN